MQHMHGGGWRDVVAEDDEHVFQQPKRRLPVLTADSPPSVPSMQMLLHLHACIPISYARPDAKTKISWTTRRATSTRALPIPRFHALLLSSVLCFMLGMSQPMPNSSTPNTRHIYRRLHTHRIRSSGLRMWMLLLRSTFSRLILNDLYDDG